MASLGDALKEAGYEPNAFTGKTDPELLIRKFIEPQEYKGCLSKASFE